MQWHPARIRELDEIFKNFAREVINRKNQNR
jgi:hypothetical protein